MSKVLRIGVAIVVHEGQVLVGIRASGTHLEGLDEFPGGKCEAGETFEDCARRECLEETGLHVTVHEKLHSERHDYGDRVVELVFFLCVAAADAGASELNSPFRWVDQREIANCHFPDGNSRVLTILQDRFATGSAGREL